MNRNIVLVLAFLLPALFEGIGIHINTQTYLFYYCSMPVILYAYLMFFKRESSTFLIPRTASYFLIFYLLGSNISFFFFSLDKPISFEYLVFSFVLFFIFIFFYGIGIEGSKIMQTCLYVLSFCFILYSLVLPLFTFLDIKALIPYTEKQVVLAIYQLHNHLGDFLGLTLLLLLVQTERKKKGGYILLSVIVFVFFITSFSRSAYLALFITLIIFFAREYRFIHRKLLYVGFMFLFITVLFAFLISSADLNKNSPWYFIQQQTLKLITFTPRGLIASRPTYYSQAIKSIQKHPFFGIGGGNFFLASKEYNTRNDITDSAHNILLEVLTEQGIITGIFFIAFCLWVIYKGIASRSPFGYLFLYLFINFQTDYTYKIHFFIVLFFICAALSLKEKKNIVLPLWVNGLINGLLLLYALCTFNSLFFLKQNLPFEALKWYPLNKDAYIAIINQETNSQTAERFITTANQLAPYDIQIIVTSAQYYSSHKAYEKALALYERIYSINRLISFSIVKELYYHKWAVRSYEEAAQFLSRVATDYRNISATNEFKEEFDSFCMANIGDVCYETGWNNKLRKKTMHNNK